MARQKSKSRHTDFEGAFTDGTVFVCPDRGEMQVTVRELGTLVTPSGKIVAGEPDQIGYPENRIPFEFRIKPGRYPVIMSEATDLCACLGVRISSKRPIRWEMATRPGENLAGLAEGQCFAYGVDRGTGGFADADALLQLANSRSWFEDVIPRIDKAEFRSGRRYCVNFTLDERTGANLIGCDAGYGDGAYASYWGYDDSGEPTWLVTDFGVLVRERGWGTIVVKNIDEMIGREIENETFRRIRARMVSVIFHEYRRYGYYFQFNGPCTIAGAILVDTDGRIVANTAEGNHYVRFDRDAEFNQYRLKCEPEDINGAKLVVFYSRGCKQLQRKRESNPLPTAASD
jgi:hypothetical protein